MTTEPYKIAIVLRDDLELPVGKIVAQAIHAVLRVGLPPDFYKNYFIEESGHLPRCIVLKVKDGKALGKLSIQCSNSGLHYALQRDAGHNFVEKDTMTCLAIGPDLESKVNVITKRLRIYEK